MQNKQYCFAQSNHDVSLRHVCAIMRVIIKTNTYFIPRFEVAEQYSLSCERFA